MLSGPRGCICPAACARRLSRIFFYSCLQVTRRRAGRVSASLVHDPVGEVENCSFDFMTGSSRDQAGRHLLLKLRG